MNTTYKTSSGQICERCPPGTFKKSDCTATSKTECQDCIGGEYMDHINYVTKCLACESCDGRYIEVESHCTKSKNTKCRCKRGYYCSHRDGEKCDFCQKISTCGPGFGIRVEATQLTDTICEPCPDGTFSNITDASSLCQRHADCSEFHQKIMTAGTNRTDNICGPISYDGDASGMFTRYLLGILAGLTVITILVIIQTVRHKRKKRGKELKQSQYNAESLDELLCLKLLQTEKEKIEMIHDHPDSNKMSGIPGFCRKNNQEISDQTATEGSEGNISVWTVSSKLSDDSVTYHELGQLVPCLYAEITKKDKYTEDKSTSKLLTPVYENTKDLQRFQNMGCLSIQEGIEDAPPLPLKHTSLLSPGRRSTHVGRVTNTIKSRKVHDMSETDFSTHLETDGAQTTDNEVQCMHNPESCLPTITASDKFNNLLAGRDTNRPPKILISPPETCFSCSESDITTDSGSEVELLKPLPPRRYRQGVHRPIPVPKRHSNSSSDSSLQPEEDEWTG
ncbi:uncharacterized protein LOC122807988 [Protopterus annectens]|uniref:uncharacterized protein LOC122807988 n=1 Tax=Protopterus annectens TaxID=7888 RepID=UPI001CFAE298|nr:uncharacterized protein LOC122807988 [Protopterus annectens]